MEVVRERGGGKDGGGVGWYSKLGEREGTRSCAVGIYRCESIFLEVHKSSVVYIRVYSLKSLVIKRQREYT